MRKSLLYPILILGISACATPIDTPIGLPERPELVPIPLEMQRQIPVDALDIIAVNQATLKFHIKRLEQRILIHDDAL